jgi:hypothetical protein
MSDPGIMPSPSPGGPGPAFVTTSDHNGRVVVASDALLTQLDSLGRLAENLRLCAGSLLGVIEVLEPQSSIGSPVPPAALQARRVSGVSVEMLLSAQNRAEQLRAAVMSCLTEYSTVEQLATNLSHRANEGIAWSMGAFVRLCGLPVAVWAGTALLASSVLTGRSPAVTLTELQSYLKQHGRALTNATTVAVIRELTSDADGFGAGYMLVPPPLAETLEATGLTNVSTSSNVVVNAGRGIGLFEPTGVSVQQTSNFEYSAPPTSLVDRAKSFPIPESDPNGEQIRIDRYVEAGKPDRFDVYIAGTVTFDPKTGTQPFDLTSDLNGVGGQSSASYQAVVRAMKEAGITPTSPVVLNGYSQGGLLTAQVAASGQFDVHGLVTFGAPSGQVAVPASIPTLTVRNAEDLVPALSGYDTNPHAVVVERPVFASGPVPSDWSVPAHRLTYYQQTAAVVDRAQSSEVRGVLDPLNAFGTGATRVDSTLWVATRVPPG